MNISKDNLIELLSVATKNQLFQFNGNLYEQVDGLAMGSPLGPLMANVFICSVEEKLACENKLPSFYKRCVDDRSKHYAVLLSLIFLLKLLLLLLLLFIFFLFYFMPLVNCPDKDLASY